MSDEPNQGPNNRTFAGIHRTELKLNRTLPNISIVVPCRNEKDFIGNVIRDIYGQTYPSDKMEVFIIDGESDDGTAEIVESLIPRYPKLQLLSNPKKIVPTALNIGIKAATGEVIVRLDAHCEYPKNYLGYLVENLIEMKADNVGVAMIAHPRNDSLKARAIAKAISCPFGIGDSYHRTGLTKAKEIDSVPFGCYKREVFEKYGLFDEELIRNQDDEFNSRIVSRGGKIWLLPDIEIKYFARGSFGKIFRKFYYYGYFKPLVNRKVGRPATIRQFVPPLFVLSLVIGLALTLIFPSAIMAFLGLVLIPYAVVNAIFSLKIAVAERSFLMLFVLPFTFFGIHVSYGLGYLRGVVRFIVLRKEVGFKDLSTNR